VLISQIVQLDAQSNEFARKHAASQIGRSDGGESFADYLAATMNPTQSRPEAGEAESASSSAEPRKTESTVRDRTPVEADSQDSRVEDASEERGSGEAAPRESEGVGEKGSRAGEDSERASREESSKVEKAEQVAVKAPAKESKESAPPDSVRPERIPVASVNTEHGEIQEETDGESLSVRKGRDAAGKAARVTSRRVSESQVEIDVEIDSEEPATDKASDSAKKVVDSSEGEKTPETDDPLKERPVADRTESNAVRKTRPVHEALDARGEAVSAAREKPDGAEKATDSAERSTRSDRRVEVRDLRSERNHDRGESGPRDGSDGGRASGESALSGDHATDNESRDSLSTHRSSQFESLRSEGGTSSPASRANDAATRNGGAAASLRHTLQEQLNGEIVRSARLVVRGDGRGDIRLNLKPEHLGTVRISLQMHDGHIAGRIIVDNQTVREVFEQNLASLQKAFEESGLEAAGIEISLADSGGQSDQSPGEPSRRASVRDAVDRFGYNVPDLSTIDEQHDLVDLVV